MGVAVGPFKPTRVDFERREHSSGSSWPYSARAPGRLRRAPIPRPRRRPPPLARWLPPLPVQCRLRLSRVIWWAITAIIKSDGLTKMIPDWAAERRRMVDRQLRRRGIHDERVLAAMLEIPREEFVPGSARGGLADAPVNIGYGQTVSQPYMTALMAEVLELTGRRQCSKSARAADMRRGAGHAGGPRDYGGDRRAAGATGPRKPEAHRPRREQQVIRRTDRADTPPMLPTMRFRWRSARPPFRRRCSNNCAIRESWRFLRK